MNELWKIFNWTFFLQLKQLTFPGHFLLSNILKVSLIHSGRVQGVKTRVEEHVHKFRTGDRWVSIYVRSNHGGVEVLNTVRLVSPACKCSPWPTYPAPRPWGLRHLDHLPFRWPSTECRCCTAMTLKHHERFHGWLFFTYKNSLFSWETLIICKASGVNTFEIAAVRTRDTQSLCGSVSVKSLRGVGGGEGV